MQPRWYLNAGNATFAFSGTATLPNGTLIRNLTFAQTDWTITKNQGWNLNGWNDIDILTYYATAGLVIAEITFDYAHVGTWSGQYFAINMWLNVTQQNGVLTQYQASASAQQATGSIKLQIAESLTNIRALYLYNRNYYDTGEYTMTNPQCSLTALTSS